MITHEQAREVIGKTVTGTDGKKLGTAGQVFLDDQTGQPEWVTVNTGKFGTKETFVPLSQAQLGDEGITVPYTKDQIKNAPKVDAQGGHLDQSEEAALYAHYGLNYSENASDSGLPEGGRASTRSQGGTGGKRSKRTTDDAMTRSEERLRAGTEKVTAGKARLRKWVDTEQEQVTVPVTKEKARLETEPITEANRDQALAGPEISEGEHEVSLTEERPVVEKETVPVERVRVVKDTEQTQETVTDDVRKERIDTDADIDLTSRDKKARR